MRTLVGRLLSIWAALATVGCLQTGESITGKFGTIETKVPQRWSEPVRLAEQEFAATGRDASCFEVEVYQEGGNLFVAFLPLLEVQNKEGDDIHLNLGATDKCGGGITFEFDRRGRLLRRAFQR